MTDPHKEALAPVAWRWRYTEDDMSSNWYLGEREPIMVRGFCQPTTIEPLVPAALLEEAVGLLRDVNRCSQGPAIDRRIEAFLSRLDAERKGEEG